jgi:nitrile hydratase
MSGHHGHDHDHAEGNLHRGYGVPFEVVETALRELLHAQGVVSEAELADMLALEGRRRPENGARLVARFWADPAFAARARADAKAAAAELGFDLTVAPGLELLENTDAVHHVVVCTLCSCSPTALIGPPPDWYKGVEYRKRVVRDPRGVLHEWGADPPDTTEVRVVDTTTETRYLVIPRRPAGTAGWSEERLARLVTRDSLYGVEEAREAGEGGE